MNGMALHSYYPGFRLLSLVIYKRLCGAAAFRRLAKASRCGAIQTNGSKQSVACRYIPVIRPR
jgi:hypothetical protein